MPQSSASPGPRASLPAHVSTQASLVRRPIPNEPAGAAADATQARPYRLAPSPLPGALPDELWRIILEAAGIFHETDPSDTEHYKPESLRLLLDLRLTSQRFNRLTLPTHDALVLADDIIKGRASPSALSQLADFSLHNMPQLDIPTTAHLQQGLRRIAAEPSEDVAHAPVVTPNRQKLKGLWRRHSSAAAESSASAAVRPREVVLRRDDLRRDGAYRQRLEAQRITEIDRLWPILERAWPDSIGGGHTPRQWVKPLVALCRLDLSPERRDPVLIDKVWPKIARLPVDSLSEPLAALLMQRDLPASIRDGAIRLLKDGHETNCTSRFHAEGLGALAIHLHQAPLEQRLHALDELMGPGGALFDLPSEHLALALVPLANLDISGASDAEKQVVFSQVQTLRRRLPEDSEMYRLLPRRVDDPHHMLIRMRRVQQGAFDPEHPEDGIGWGGTPFTLQDLFDTFGGGVRSADEPMSLNDFRQMISIARIGYQAQAPDDFGFSFLLYQADILGCLKPEACLQGIRAVVEEMHRPHAVSAAFVLHNLIGRADTKRKRPLDDEGPLLRVPPTDIRAFLGLLEREIDSSETYNPRELIAKMELMLPYRSDIKAIRPQAKQLLEGLVARHPHLIIDEYGRDGPKFQTQPLSKYWQRPAG